MHLYSTEQAYSTEQTDRTDRLTILKEIRMDASIGACKWWDQGAIMHDCIRSWAWADLNVCPVWELAWHRECVDALRTAGRLYSGRYASAEAFSLYAQAWWTLVDLGIHAPVDECMDRVWVV